MLLPVFCYDNSTLSLVCTASTARVRPLIRIPDARPMELMPGRCLVTLNCFEYRKTDIGPYNEVAISFLIVRSGLNVPGLTFLYELVRRRFGAYVWQLPVTTEVARDGGLEIYGYPKFLADIRFTNDGGRFRCVVAERGAAILTAEGPVLPVRPQPGLRFVTYSLKDGIPLRANIVQNATMGAIGICRRDVSLALGNDHPVARQLSELKLGSRPLAYVYAPRSESVLFAARNLMDD
jgi:Acetoacetate decarboxylase (ADC)